MSKHQITIEATNNPSIVKFNSNQLLTQGGSYQYNNVDETKESPLSKQLFHLPFVSKVFISANFIAIEKFDIVEWSDIEHEIRELIEMYLNQGNEVVTSAAEPKKVSIEIYAESTPNPEVMKFGSNRLLTENDFEYKNESETTNSPLAAELFKYVFVKEVYIAENYVSITKNDSVEWNSDIINDLRQFIKTYIEENKLIIDETMQMPKVEIPTVDIKELEGTSLDIAGILEEYVKPAVAADGGNIVFQSYDEETQVVNVILQGACSGCPSSTVTLKNGIETMLKEMLPNKVSAVMAVNG
ncbi:NifU family protein [Flavicella sp.]|uniref:NifU family protein n=1 Tax=Flavicella sp. TaxID=2957742 RepID=UPI00262F0C39|nr:NifU family protein [Flavicella sp.]MDG1804454.1 NifU family protein [Flavicella sp.]